MRSLSSPAFVRSLFVSCVLLMCLALAACGSDEGGSGPWKAPACAQTKGAAGLTYTKNAGDTLADRDMVLGRQVYASDIALMKAPSTMLAHYERAFFRTTDSGCTWTVVAGTEQAFVRIRPAGETLAYAFNPGLPFVWKLDGDTLTQKTVDGSMGFLALEVDRGNAQHVVAVDRSCAVFETTDGGDNWDMLTGAPAMTERFLLTGMFAAAIDPSNLSHALCSGPNDGEDIGLIETKDKGATWTTSMVAPAPAFTSGMFVAYSQVDPNVVWLVTRDQSAEMQSGSDMFSLRRSTDGGATFTRVIGDDTALGLSLVNTNTIRPDLTSASVLYIAAGDGIFKLDAATMMLTGKHNDEGITVHTVLPLPGTNVLMVGLQQVLR